MRNRSITRPSNKAVYYRRKSFDYRQRNQQPKFEYLTEIHGAKIIMTDHAKKQCQARHGLKLEQCKQWFVDMTDVWASVPVEYENEEVFVYSYKWQRGMILAYRRDYKNETRNDTAVVAVTVYPYGVASPANKDTRCFRG